MSEQPSGPPTGPPERQLGPSSTIVGVVLLAVSGVALFAAGLSLGSQGAGRDAGERAAVEAFTETYRYYTQRQGYVREYRTHPMWMHDVTETWLERTGMRGTALGRAPFTKNVLSSLLGERAQDRR